MRRGEGRAWQGGGRGGKGVAGRGQGRGGRGREGHATGWGSGWHRQVSSLHRAREESSQSIRHSSAPTRPRLHLRQLPYQKDHADGR